MKTFIVVIVALLLLIPSPTYAQNKLIEWAPTGLFDDGKEILLEVVIYKPKKEGPSPTLIFNHGSTDGNLSYAKVTYTAKALAKFFTDQGWLVPFPQRRGRGKSGGVYDEGYSCSTERALAGFERALQDLDTAVKYLTARPDVNKEKMLLGGQSRGGILSIVYAGTRTHPFKGVINFVGGWVSDRCVNAASINTASFRRGAGFRNQTLWLYGKADKFYSIQHSRKNFEAFIAEGGKGMFIEYAVPNSQNGHAVLYHPSLWEKTITSFLENLE